MRTLLIVDDEKPARELLKMTLEWEEAGFSAPLEACGGQEALALYQARRPDLVITDIQMPAMDGLELIRRIRALDGSQKIIILSCHESFSYAREALQMGVLDYLLKDALTPEALLAVLVRIFQEDEPALPQTDPVPPSPGILREALGGSDQQAARLLAPLLDEANAYFCCAAKPEQEGAPFEGLELAAAQAARLLHSLGGGEACLMPDGSLLLLAFAPRSRSRMNLVNRRLNVIQSIHSLLEEATGRRVSLGISQPQTDPQRLPQAVEQARQALGARVFLGKGRALYYDPIQNQMQPAQLKLLELRTEEVREALESGDAERLAQAVALLYKKDLQGMMQYNYLQHVSAVLMGMLTGGCSSHGISYREVFGTDTVSLEAVDRLETVDELCSWFSQRFARLLEAARRQEQEAHSPRMHRILEHIQANYQNSDICLDSVADAFGIHKVYLSKIFKKDTGRSVNDFIRELRIQKAKELLCRKDVRVTDLVELLGFHNPQTFYNMFKKSEGLSPSEYRELHSGSR